MVFRADLSCLDFLEINRNSKYAYGQAQDEATMKKICNSRAVLTLAVGKTIYFLMAVNLARSFIVWHRDGKIDFVIATRSRVG